jgi:voltage-gated potassium channel
MAMSGKMVERFTSALNLFITALILLNIAALVLETVESIGSAHRALFYKFEVFSVLIFTVEYIIRLWKCTDQPQYGKGLAGRVRYILSPMALIDAVAILPFYLPMLIPFDLRFVRALRLLRIFRIFKLARYSDAFRTFMNVMRAKKEELLITVFMVFVVLTVASCAMFFIENSVQPNIFSSIPAAMWWGIATLSTVGYGDMYPVTLAGKLLGSIVALMGIGLFALPAGIIGSGFIDEMHKKRANTNCCPHCGKTIEIK